MPNRAPRSKSGALYLLGWRRGRAHMIGKTRDDDDKEEMR